MKWGVFPESLYASTYTLTVYSQSKFSLKDKKISSTPSWTYKEFSVNVDFSEVGIDLPTPDSEDAEVTCVQVHGFWDGDHKVIHRQSSVGCALFKVAFTVNNKISLLSFFPCTPEIKLHPKIKSTFPHHIRTVQHRKFHVEF